MGKFTDKDINEMKPVVKTLNAQVYGDNPSLSKPIDLYLNFIELFQRTKIFINLNVHTNLPYELLIAMACGCGIVSNSPSIVKSILEHEKNAILVDDMSTVVAAAQKLINNKSLLEESIKINKGLIAQLFNMDKFVKSWTQILEDIRQEVFIL
jgi:glycosyltransferase involved in cell wall biosynthesis